MITNLGLENFKSWLRLPAVRLAPITGLFGTNSSGKTSVSQLLLMMKQTVESSDRSQVLKLGDEKSRVDLGTFQDVIYGHDKTRKLKFDFKWNPKNELTIKDPEHKGKNLFADKEIEFDCSITQDESRRIRVSEFAYSLAHQRFALKQQSNPSRYSLSATQKTGGRKFKFVRAPGRPWELPQPIKCYGFPDQMKAYYKNAGFLADIVLEFEKLFAGLYYLGPLREHPKRQYTWDGAQPGDMGERGEKVVDAILASRESGTKISRGKGIKSFTVEQYAAYWLKELGLIHKFAVRPITEGSKHFEVWVQKTPASTEVLITDVGFGVSQILPVLVLCYYVPEGSTIILEQPEIHLHPSVQAGLADVFIDAIKNKKIQIIVESHSEHLLKRLQRRIAEERLLPNDAALYFCDMNDGSSRMTTLELDLFGQIANWPKDFFGDQFGEMAATTRAIAERRLAVGKNASH